MEQWIPTGVEPMKQWVDGLLARESEAETIKAHLQDKLVTNLPYVKLRSTFPKLTQSMQ